jgi:hypothetical protein
LREDEDADPTERDADDCGQPLGRGDPGEFREDRQGGSGPDHGEDGLLPGSVKDEPEGRVGGGYQAKMPAWYEPS